MHQNAKIFELIDLLNVLTLTKKGRRGALATLKDQDRGLVHIDSRLCSTKMCKNIELL